jgi:hypothetical protein
MQSRSIPSKQCSLLCGEADKDESRLNIFMKKMADFSNLLFLKIRFTFTHTCSMCLHQKNIKTQSGGILLLYYIKREKFLE